jgi:hypothetical protein
MVRFRRVAAVLVLSAPLFFAAGCQQSAGERCQVQDDCQSDLLCVFPAGGTPQAGGFCEPPNSLLGDIGVDMTVTTISDAGSKDLAQPPVTTDGSI